MLFLAADLTQIQYDPDGDEPCTSFSVTVAGRQPEGRGHRRSPTRSCSPLVRRADGRRLRRLHASACPATRSPLDRGPADPPLFDPSGQPEGQTIAHATLGTDQVAEIHVPGLVVIDLVGERVEQVELQRGTADVWFGPDFVQVRWFTGSQEQCESFTVTVAGGTEDGNRHAAVDLADRILLESELGAAVAAARPSGSSSARRSTASHRRERVDVHLPARTTCTWTDGCNELQRARSPATAAGPRACWTATTARPRSPRPSSVASPTRRAEAISAVMAAGTRSTSPTTATCSC